VLLSRFSLARRTALERAPELPLLLQRICVLRGIEFAWRRVNDAGNLTGARIFAINYSRKQQLFLCPRVTRVTGRAHKRVLIFINTLPRIPRVAQGIIQLFRNSAFHTLPGAELHRQAIMPGAKPDIPPLRVISYHRRNIVRQTIDHVSP